MSMHRYFQRVAADDEEGEINITPMLDVVFILLIFFIVTTSFVRESGLDVNMPRARTTASLDTAAILVGVSATGQFWMEGKPVDRRALRANIARQHAANPQGGLVVQADAGARAADVVAAMDAAREAGVHQVALAAREP